MHRASFADRRRGCGEDAATHWAKVRTVEFGPDDDLVGTDADGATDRRRALGHQRGNAAVQNAVGLVNLRANLNLQHDSLRRDFNDADTELLVHVRSFAESGSDLVAHRTIVEVGR